MLNLATFTFCFWTLALSSSALALKFPTIHNVSDVAVGDINGDGINDIVTCGSIDTHSSVDVLLGNGDGTFQNPKDSFVGPDPIELAVGDFNLDGHLDVVTANFGIEDGSGNTVSMLLGYGDGTFQNRHDFAVVDRPNSIVVSDVNGDGYLDFVVGEFSQFVVLLGNGRGRFVLGSSTTLPNNSRGVAVGDVNGDGKIDVVAGSTIPSLAALSLGNGDGTFETPTEFNSGAAMTHVLLMDVNADGLPDFIGSSSKPFFSWQVFSNNGSGTFLQIFGAMFNFPVGGFTPGYFNSDGDLDFAVTAEDSSGNELLVIYAGKGDGRFEPFDTGLVLGEVIATGDFNGDARMDLVGGGRASLSVQTVYGRANGTFVRFPPPL
jgi:hypothetical protein